MIDATLYRILAKEKKTVTNLNLIFFTIWSHGIS